MPSIRILLVDDSPLFLRSAANLLATDPNIAVVGCALSGQEALEQIVDVAPDLVLMDLMMPYMNGLEATRRIKADRDAPEVIILTLYDNAQYRAAAKDVGADGFVSKTELGTRLRPLIGQLIDGDDCSSRDGKQGGGEKSDAFLNTD